MKKVQLHLTKTVLTDNELISKLQGFLMEEIASEYAGILHQQETNPYSTNLISDQNESVWTVNLLTNEAEEHILPKLMSLEKIDLKSFSNTIVVKHVTMQTLSQEHLLEIFQSNEESHLIHLTFYTPTTFKSQGSYALFPDTRLIFQSLMQKYTRLVEQKDEIEEETLIFLAEHSRISSYQLKSYYFSVHRKKFPAFKGRITIKISGPATLKAYANMLLKFGEYSGIGIKCSLGMGGMRIEERKT
ncbi:MAG: CRISPR-associated endoribonuclease Cas6 [Streptococcus sp.]|nr:CRISPR-associated endoribonuclease Cas6 [Streptococcus sp.]